MLLEQQLANVNVLLSGMTIEQRRAELMPLLFVPPRA